MKGRLVVVAFIGAAVIAFLVYRGVLGGQLVELKCHYEKLDCAEKKYFMTVVSVTDSAAIHLIGNKVSPEAIFKQTKLNDFIQANLKNNSKHDFYLIGYLKSSTVKHCFDSKCFRVRKIRSEAVNSFTEF